MNSKFNSLLVETKNKVAIVTINRPKQLNALNQEVYKELNEALVIIEEEKGLKAVIITGSGNKAFVAGADILEMKGMSPHEARRFAFSGKRVGRQIIDSRLPFIAAVNGFALGGGCELAMSCDLIIASGNATFGQPEINLGLIPGNGGTQRLTRMVGLAKAKELILLGGQINAQNALEIGLVNKVVDDQELMVEAERWAHKLSGKGGIALALAKSAMNSGINVDLNTGLDYEIECFAQCFATDDFIEGSTAFVEKRKPQFKDS